MFTLVHSSSRWKLHGLIVNIKTQCLLHGHSQMTRVGGKNSSFIRASGAESGLKELVGGKCIAMGLLLLLLLLLFSSLPPLCLFVSPSPSLPHPSEVWISCFRSHAFRFNQVCVVI